VAIVIVDLEARIRGFLPQLDGLLGNGLILLDPVEFVRYAAP
jgi:PII-like signaling protein